jgi:hypothetical protein
MVDRSIEVSNATLEPERAASFKDAPLASVATATAEMTEEIHLLRGGIAHVKSAGHLSIAFIPYRAVAWTDISTAKAGRKNFSLVRILASNAPEALPSLSFADAAQANSFYALLLDAMS